MWPFGRPAFLRGENEFEGVCSFKLDRLGEDLVLSQSANSLDGQF